MNNTLKIGCRVEKSRFNTFSFEWETISGKIVAQHKDESCVFFDHRESGLWLKTSTLFPSKKN